jgi:pseudouridine-5'-phosphate glycosidase
LAGLSEEVFEALAGGGAVVALESTLIAHGLPRPRNLVVARQLEADIRAAGAVPATIALLDGEVRIGLDDQGLQRIAGDGVAKLGVRDLALAAVRGVDGATTVASTAHLAARAGIRVFATGGLGGVHRGARESWDESGDLETLARTPITVVAAGVKSILDIGATLERLESLSVTVLVFGTERFPAFYLADSGYTVDFPVTTAEEVAQIMQASDALAMPGGILVANPLPEAAQLDPALHDRLLAEALAAAEAASVRGKQITPFLLDYIHRHTERTSVAVNLDIVRGNCRLGADIARAWSALRVTD